MASVLLVWMHCYFHSVDVIFFLMSSHLLMQYHLADPTILYFDSEERNNATISRKKSWKGLYQNVNNKISLD